MIGEDYVTKAQKQLERQKNRIYKLIPQRVFAWFPCKIENDGRKAWLQFVWKYTQHLNNSDWHNTYFYLDEYEAYKSSYYSKNKKMTMYSYSLHEPEIWESFTDVNNILSKKIQDGRSFKE
jgi:hypothetical protein